MKALRPNLISYSSVGNWESREQEMGQKWEQEMGNGNFAQKAAGAETIRDSQLSCSQIESGTTRSWDSWQPSNLVHE